MNDEPYATLNFYWMYTDKILNTAYSFAAAIVVFGAWAKLEHKDFGGTALTVGMLVESCIFVIYGFVEWREKRQTASQPSASEQAVPGQSAPGVSGEIAELKQTMEKTNGILRKIFRAEEA